MQLSTRKTLAELGVTTVPSVRQPVGLLTGGQRQAVAIAKSLLWKLRLVLMDEPTAALGVQQTEVVLRLVRTPADRGPAVIAISHNMNGVLHVADRVAVLYLGRLAVGHPASDVDKETLIELMTTGRSSRIEPQGTE